MIIIFYNLQGYFKLEIICKLKGIASFQTNKSSYNSSNLVIIKKGKKHDSCLTEENLSSFNEELSKSNNKKASSKNEENAEENTEILSVSDVDNRDTEDSDQTSDDASDIPDSECLDDLASLDDLEDPFSMDQTAKVFNQVMEKDGSILRKKLDYGIYRSVNHTLSLFIEPEDVLKKVDIDEYEEYSLFPNGMESVESYLCAMVM